MTEETKAKLSALLKGKKRPAYIGEAVRKAQTGRKHTPEHNAKIAESGKKAINKGQFKKGAEPWNKGKTGVYKEAVLKIWGKIRRGKIHKSNKGKTKEQERIRKSADYRDFRLSVYERDDFTCQMPGCGVKGGKLNAHHIEKFSDFPELRMATDNGITLCRECHIKIHHKEFWYIEMFKAIVTNKIQGIV